MIDCFRKFQVGDNIFEWEEPVYSFQLAYSFLIGLHSVSITRRQLSVRILKDRFAKRDLIG